jgi:segregation and condensation protein A
MLDLIYRIKQKKRMRFEEAFSDAPTKEEVVTYFLAVLELLKLGQMHVRQDEVYGGIELLSGRPRKKKAEDLADLAQKGDGEP